MLQNTAKTAIGWSTLDVFARQAMGFVISMLLARLLVPEDFGTVALLSVFTGIAGLFVNAGLSMALIQRQDVNRTDESTVFWFNVGTAVLMMLLLSAAAPWIADFFRAPVLVPLTFAMAANIVINSLGSVHGTLLRKRLAFKTLMKAGVASTLVSGGLGVLLAWQGFGVWALAAQTVTASLVSLTMLWVLNPWRPLAVFSRESFHKLFGFSAWVFLSWLLDTLFQRAYTLLIGKAYGTHELGIYGRADSTQQLASGVLTDVVSKVAFPLFSSVNDDKERLRRGMRLAIRLVTLVTAPAMMGLAALAGPFIGVVFGPQWLPSAPILQVLCIAGVLYPLHVINLDVLQAQGQSSLFFRLELAKKGVGTVLLVGGCYFGVMGLAWSRVAASVVGLFINTYYTRKLLGYGLLAQVRDCLPSLLLSGMMAAFVHFIHAHLGPNAILQLIASVLCGAIAYVVLNLLSGATAFREILSLVVGRERRT